MKIYEYIVVGSGCTGAMAAQTLVEAGVDTLMLDVGITKQSNHQIPQEKGFLDIRKSEVDQYKYLIGEDFEGVSWGKVGKGEQITPPRKHIFAKTNSLIPVSSTSFFPAESLGYGGLGIGWGVGCWEFSQSEANQAGLDHERMQSAYKVVSRRIGISATRDSATKYSLGSLDNFQESPEMDRNHTQILKSYTAHKSTMNKRGFFMGRAPLAVITQSTNERKSYAYKDLDFYSDDDMSAYRPWMTVDNLKKCQNFTYRGNMLVTKFSEKKEYTIVECINISDGKTKLFRCKKLLLAPGVLGSARIALRSFNITDARTPLLCNPYSYIPCIQPSMLGKGSEAKKLGFAQLSLFLDKSSEMSDVSMASLYSYQSLMLFRLARQVPFNFSDSRRLFQYLSPAVVIMGVHQPDRPSAGKYLELVEDKNSITGDSLKATYISTADEISERKKRERKYIKIMRKMHVYALKNIDPGMGASIHYAGTLPFSAEERLLTTRKDGLLHGSKSVYIADGSGFTFLPAKGLTFSLMANAHNVAENALNS